MIHNNNFVTEEPILFCIYRGLENTKKSFKTIKDVKPKSLYML